MANMSYCRFENTAQDLADCQEHIDDCLTSKSEIRARKRLIRICKQIADDFQDEDLAMSYWSHNPELLEEVTVRFLPKEWREKVENEEIDLYDVPQDIRDKAMLEGEQDYWGGRIDEAM